MTTPNSDSHTLFLPHSDYIDGVKYSLKTCETILYELSVTGCEEVLQEPPTKRPKLTLLPMEELTLLQQKMEQKDELREKLIKQCRDGQKAAKQAIYALHREDYAGANLLLEKCETCILQELQPIVEQEQSLRFGSSFANVLEEYAEAKLYQAWLGEESSSPAGKVLLHEDFTKVTLDPQEYLGGLCDLTGEIGRYAVKRATARDTKNVVKCMETNMSILYAIEALSSHGNIGKKMDPLRRTVEKQERMLYELSLVEATGRNTIVADVPNEKEEQE